MKTSFSSLVPVFVVLFLVFSSCFVVYNAERVQASSASIVVPDDYPLIQDAIDAAQDGDTIFVKNGVYYETLVVDKSLTLIGENREQTIIDAHKLTKSVVHILAKGVTITNFTVGNTGSISSSGQLQPSGFLVEGHANIIHNTICDVSGPAFDNRRTGGATLRDNLVSEGSFVIVRSFFNSEIPYDEQAIEVKDMPSPFPAAVELLEGNQVLHLTRTNGASLGDLVLKDNATLIVDNFDAKAQTFKAFDNSRIILLNGAYLFEHKKTGNTPMRLYLMDNASFSLTDSSTVNLVCRNNTHITAKNSTLWEISVHDNVVVELTNCTTYGFRADGLANASVYNSTFRIDSISGEAQVLVKDSYVQESSGSIGLSGKGKLWLINSNSVGDLSINGESNLWFIDCIIRHSYRFMYLRDSSNLWFINSTWQQVKKLVLENQSILWFINSNNATDVAQELIFDSVEAKVNYGYQLQVTVESKDRVSLEGILVEVRLPNDTLIDTGITDVNGNTQFILASRTWNNQTTEDFDSYIVKASKGWSQTKTTVELDSNKQITMSIDVSAFGFFSDTNIILLLVGILAGAIILVFLKKRE